MGEFVDSFGYADYCEDTEDGGGEGEDCGGFQWRSREEFDLGEKGGEEEGETDRGSDQGACRTRGRRRGRD